MQDNLQRKTKVAELHPPSKTFSKDNAVLIHMLILCPLQPRLSVKIMQFLYICSYYVHYNQVHIKYCVHCLVEIQAQLKKQADAQAQQAHRADGERSKGCVGHAIWQ